MEPEGLLPLSEVPTIFPYPEPARSSPYPHIIIPITLIIFCKNGGLKIIAAFFRSFAFSTLIFYVIDMSFSAPQSHSQFTFSFDTYKTISQWKRIYLFIYL